MLGPPTTILLEAVVTNFWLFVHLIGRAILAAGVGTANLSGILLAKTESPAMLAMWSGINIRPNG